MATPPDVLRGGVVQPGSAANLFRRSLGSPALGTTTAVLAATASAAGSTVTAGITQPDTCRNITATSGGTGANVTAVSVVINGTDIFGQSISETLPAFTAGATGTVTGSKAFATVTSIQIPTVGASTTVAVGLGAKLGLPHVGNTDTVLNAYLNKVRESTRPTVAFDGTNPCNNTVTLNSALNGNEVLVDYYAAF
jgi:hypothetical protein